MRATGNRECRNRRSAFTLVEMMVVVAIIAILIGGVFKLLGAAGEKNKESVTVMRMERLQNALSGYYAEYGSYPPVMQYEYPDPEKQRNADDPTKVDNATFSSDSANLAASSQSIAYEFPPVTSLDDYIDKLFQGKARSAGLVLGGQNLRQKTEWESWYKLQLFKFGLLSYLLPRTHIAWGDDSEARRENLFESLQWTRKDPNTYPNKIKGLINAQMAIEERTVARWLPNFEKIICGGVTIMGVELCEKDTWLKFVSHTAPNGQKLVVQSMTIRDGWGRDLYYYSAAPYQSYRIWSSGKDGKTYPPWIPIDQLQKKSASQAKLATTWIEDDIVRFDH